MTITPNQMTAQCPMQHLSGSAMLTRGHAFDVLSIVTTGRTGTSDVSTGVGTVGGSIVVTTGTVARDRRDATVLGYAAEKPFPGTRAWRPPSR